MAIDSKKLFEDVKANFRALEGCAGPHEFEPSDYYAGGTLFRRYKRNLCGGKVDSHGRYWYQLGLKHGKGTE